MDASNALDSFLDTLLSTNSSDMTLGLMIAAADASRQQHATPTVPPPPPQACQAPPPSVTASAEEVEAANAWSVEPKREAKRKVGSSYEPESTVEKEHMSVAEKRRAQNRRHAAVSRQRKVDALHGSLAERSRLKKENVLLTKALREASVALEYVLECVEDLPNEHRDAIAIQYKAFVASRSAANSALKGL